MTSLLLSSFQSDNLDVKRCCDTHSPPLAAAARAATTVATQATAATLLPFLPVPAAVFSTSTVIIITATATGQHGARDSCLEKSLFGSHG